MKKALCLAAMLALAGLTSVAPVDAQSSGALRADPFHFGLGAHASWTRDSGEPGSKGDPMQFGLYLQKHTNTTSFAAGGADLKRAPRNAAALEVLAFNIPGHPAVTDFDVDNSGDGANGYCGAGAPRFTVITSGAGTCHLGCTYGAKTQRASGWWEIRFVAPFTQYPGCEGGVSGTVEELFVLLDEGHDQGPGSVTLDNIRVNNRVIGRPLGGQ